MTLLLHNRLLRVGSVPNLYLVTVTDPRQLNDGLLISRFLLLVGLLMVVGKRFNLLFNRSLS